MSIISKRAALCVAAVLLGIGGCASRPQSHGAELAYRGPPLGFGSTPTAADLAGDFSYPADGRGLPPGSGTYAQGEQIYRQQCLACHGDQLQGGLGDRLIGGRGTLTKRPSR